MERSLLKKMTVAKLVKKFPAFHRTQDFITAFTRVCHWTTWTRRNSIHTLKIYFFNIHFNIILPCMSRCPDILWYPSQGFANYSYPKQDTSGPQLPHPVYPWSFLTSNVYSI